MPGPRPTPQKTSKPVPLGGVKKRASHAPYSGKKPKAAKKSGVPAKRTGGYTKREKESWGAWSPTRVVKPSKKTAAGVEEKSEIARGMK